VLARVTLLLLACAGAIGCFKLDPADRLLVCNSAGKACPDGYACGGDNHCYRIGHEPDLSVGGGNPPGTRCSTGSECTNGICVDGYCCDRACDGQCEACNVGGQEGRCSFVSGSPVAPREACGGSGQCAGTCDGTAASCRYPSTSVICGASCDGTCNGAGACSSATGGSCPNGYGCGPSGCLTACQKDADCQPFFKCNAPTCERVGESDCLDGIDNNGDGLADCADPSCNGVVVQCVNTPAAGGELGIFIASGTCPANYGTTEAWHAGLRPNACTGCSCQSTCSSTITIWSSDNGCSAGGTAVTITAPPTGNSVCRSVLNTTYTSGTVSTPVIGGCTGTGTATQPDPTWTTDMTFCAARTSSTCGSPSKLCVAIPAAQKVCARGNQADACPSGYASDKGVFYSSFQRGSCTGSCASCTPATSASLTCKPSAFMPLAYVGANCTGAATFLDTSCGVLNRGAYQSVGTGYTSTGTDNCRNNITDTPPSPTGAARVCCQP
jgi:hypothetical protein